MDFKYMNTRTKLALKKVIEVNEETGGARTTIDYVGILLTTIEPNILEKFDKFINEEYRRYDN